MSHEQNAGASSHRVTIDRKKVHAVGLCGALFLAGAGYFLGVVPLITDRREADSHQHHLSLVQAESERTARELERTREALRAAGTSGQLGLIPENRLHETLLARSRESGVLLSDVHIGTPQVFGSLLRTPVEARGSGAFSDMMRLMDRVRDDMPGVSIDGITIMRDGDEHSSLTVHLLLSSYAPQASPADANMDSSHASTASRSGPIR